MAVTLTWVPAGEETVWAPVKIGGGGYATGMDISADGLTRVFRNDTCGAYIWNEAGGIWDNLCSYDRMPADSRGNGGEWHEGVYAIAIAPSNSAILYMMWLGYVFKSVNRGATWTRTAKARAAAADSDPNHTQSRVFNYRMAIDPINPNVVYVGHISTGVYRTFDGGATWAQVPTASIPLPADTATGQQHSQLIAFDPSSTATGGRTNRLIINSGGNGIYQSTDAGVTWADIATSSGPTDGSIQVGKFAQDGVYYCCENCYITGNAPPRKLWRYMSGTWADITPNPTRLIWTFAIDPADPAHIIAVNDGTTLWNNTNRGSATWTVESGKIRTGSDAEWLDVVNETHMAVSDLRFDPTVPGRLWKPDGIGICYTDSFPTTGVTEWSYLINGVENLSCNWAVCPDWVGAKPIIASWDRAFFRIDDPDVFPSDYGPDSQTGGLQHGWAVDWVAGTPGFLVACATNPGPHVDCYSTDGGINWTYFPAQVPNVNGPTTAPTGWAGTIAASTTTNFIRCVSNNGDLWRTMNGGTSWLKCTVPGIPAAATGIDPGWGWAHYNRTLRLAADRVTTGKFYAYNDGIDGGTTGAGVYVTTDGGATWTAAPARAGGPPAGGYFWYAGGNSKLKTVPGKAGHVFFASGPQGGGVDTVHPGNGEFVYSLDGAATWLTVPDMPEIKDFGFGKVAPGNDYPTVFAIGWRGPRNPSAEFGIWRSTSSAAAWAANTPTWTKIGDYPYFWPDGSTDCDGDKNEYGKVYITMSGSSAMYGRLA